MSIYFNLQVSMSLNILHRCNCTVILYMDWEEFCYEMIHFLLGPLIYFVYYCTCTEAVSKELHTTNVLGEGGDRKYGPI